MAGTNLLLMSGTCNVSIHMVAQAGTEQRPQFSLPASLAADQVMAWCQNYRLPANLAQTDSKVVWSNNAGSALLAEREHFSLRAGKLICMDSSRETLFHAFVEKDAGRDLSTWISSRGASTLIVLREELPGNQLRGFSFHGV